MTILLCCKDSASTISSNSKDLNDTKMPLSVTRQDRIDRLRAGLQGQSSQLNSVQPGNIHIFTSVALHALVRKRRGKIPLSKLEAFTAGLFESLADSEDELDDFVQAVSSARSSRAAGGWLTASTLSLGEDEPYTKEHFQKDFASLDIGINAQSSQIAANSRIIDPVAGEEVDTEDASFADAAREAKHSTTVYWSEPKISTDGISVLDIPSGIHGVKLKPTCFYCHKKSGEWTRDEIYWSLAAGADTDDQLTKKQVTGESGAVTSNSWHDLASDVILFDGVVERVLAAHIVCWEADDSNSAWYDKLIQVSRELSRMSARLSVITGNQAWDELIGQIPAVGMRQEILMWTQLISQLFADFLDLFRNHDDKVKDAYMVWNLPALDHLFVANAKQEMSVLFDGGGGGKHTLYISRQRRGSYYDNARVMTVECEDADLKSWKVVDRSLTCDTVAQLPYLLKVWSVIKLHSNGALAVTSDLLSNSGSIKLIPGHYTPSRPELSANSEGLHLAYQGGDNRLYVLYRGWLQSDWTVWDFETYEHLKTNRSPNICNFMDTPVCIHYGLDGNTWWMKRVRGVWGGCNRMQTHERAYSAAAACNYLDKLYYFYTDGEHKIRVAVLTLEQMMKDEPSIEDYDLGPFETRGSISATLVSSDIYIAYSRVLPEPKPCIDRYDMARRCLVPVMAHEGLCPIGDPSIARWKSGMRMTFSTQANL